MILHIIIIQIPCKYNNIWILFIDIVYNLMSSRKLKFKSPAQKRQIKISSPK